MKKKKIMFIKIIKKIKTRNFQKFQIFFLQNCAKNSENYLYLSIAKFSRHKVNLNKLL